MSTSLERLAHIRQEIDTVDKELLHMLNKRASLSLEVGRIKAHDSSNIFKPRREIDVVSALENNNTGPLPNKHLRTIWREIFSSSRTLQRPQKVAYLGPEGTFSYFAGVEYLGKSVEFQPCRHLHDVFRTVFEKQCALGVVPLENSLQGTVVQSFDLFYTFDVSIQAELFLRISHALLSTEKSFSAIQRVYSHPQPLAQCDAWLRTNLPQVSLIPVESTAAAARRAAEEPGSAAIGNVALSDILSLHVLAHAIEDHPDNWTRFVIIAPVEAKNTSLPVQSQSTQDTAQQNIQSSSEYKTSLLFTLPDKVGSLSSVLETLALYHINMRKLESRPLRLSSGEHWKYVFFVDVEADLTQAQHTNLVEKLRSLCMAFRILGAYPTVPLFTS